MRFSDSVAAPAALPPGKRVYAVGDVHGQASSLTLILDRIAADAAGHADATIVLLGDLVDRGLDSAGAVALARAGVPGMTMVALMGNHEAMMLQALRGARDAARTWLENGGVETLASFAVPRGTGPADWHRHIPADIQDFLAARPLQWQAGGYLFAHAGIRPGIPLARQSPHDLLWIREPFLSWPDPLPLVVVHGHTPAEAPEVLPHRIGLDTGAGWGRDLTCAALEGATVRFLTV